MNKNLIQLVVAAALATGAAAIVQADDGQQAAGAQAPDAASFSPLVERVRRATEKYLNVKTAAATEMIANVIQSAGRRNILGKKSQKVWGVQWDNWARLPISCTSEIGRRP